MEKPLAECKSCNHQDFLLVFPCLTAAWSYSDLLKRHAAKHNDSEQASISTSSTSKRRKTLADAHRPRAQRACQTCADAKARCEGSNPCLRCQQKSIACRYPQPRSTGAPDPTQNILSRSQDSQDSQDEAQQQTQDHSPSLTRTSAPPQMAQTPRGDGMQPPDSTSAQPDGFQLAAPSMFVPGRSHFPSLIPVDLPVIH